MNGPWSALLSGAYRKNKNKKIQCKKCAWEDYTKNHAEEITKAFKHCGMFNKMDGSENHLVRLRKCKTYKVPAKDAKPEPLAKKQRKKKKVQKKTT